MADEKRRFQNASFHWTDYSDFDPDRGGSTPNYSYYINGGIVTGNVQDHYEEGIKPHSITHIAEQIEGHIAQMESEIEKARAFLRSLKQPGLVFQASESDDSESEDGSEDES